MPQLQADATPAKRFFIDLITRDISLEDSILDLVDNSIDSLVRSAGIDVTANTLTTPPLNIDASKLPTIEVTVSVSEISVKDRSGGIELQRAINEVFHLGGAVPSVAGTLGVYGIGLKRAMFKLGNRIRMTSRTIKNGFSLDLDVDEWRDSSKEWKIPLKAEPGVRFSSAAGTSIRITDLRPAVRSRIQDGTLAARLHSILAVTYCLFIDRYVRITLNGSPVAREPLPLGGSDEVNQQKDSFVVDGVDVSIFAGLAARIRGQWNVERAGWYVLCNARVIVAADRTELTGWGTATAQFVSKYRGFVGVAFFFSRNPELLPWTTTKRGLNVESPTYQIARRHMQMAARPVLTFLNKMYPGEEQEHGPERAIADDVRPIDVRALNGSASGSFRVTPRTGRAAKSTIKVQYDAEIADIERAKRCLKRQGWGASRIGKYALEYLLSRECDE